MSGSGPNHTTAQRRSEARFQELRTEPMGEFKLSEFLGGPDRLTIASRYEKSSSSASATVLSPTSSQRESAAMRSAGSMFVSGIRQRVNPI